MAFLRFSLNAEDLTGFFAFPVASLLQRPVEFDGAGTRTIVDAGAAIPAFLRMQDNRALVLFGIGDENIHGAVFHTRVAPVAYLGIKNCRSARCCYIGNSINCHSSPLCQSFDDPIVRHAWPISGIKISCPACPIDHKRQRRTRERLSFA